MCLKLVIGMAAALALAGCTKIPPITSNGDLAVTNFEALPPPTAADVRPARPGYLIGPRDKLAVTVFGIDDLSSKSQVDSSGRISVPLAGSIDVAGETPEQVARTIEDRLRTHYVRRPQVTVNVEESLSQIVTVDGEVREPGLYPVLNNMTLLRAVAAAKGSSEFAKLDDVVVFRTVEGKRLAALYNLAAIRRGIYLDPPIYANDVVVVGDSPGRRLFKNLIQLTPLLTTPIIIALQKI
jgi:polysaccharide biosynthesis/export protein